MTTSSHQTVLLTGASGFFGGRYLCQSAERYDTVYALDRVCSEIPLPSSVQNIVCDLRDESAWADLPAQVDVVIYAAAVLPSHEDDEIFDTDVRATLRLLHWSKMVGVKQFVHISSTAVYGAAYPLPLNFRPRRGLRAEGHH